MFKNLVTSIEQVLKQLNWIISPIQPKKKIFTITANPLNL